MNVRRIVGIATACATVVVVGFVVMLLALRLLWAWVVPDLFPAAVAQGLVAESISWLTAAKVALVLALVSGFTSGSHTCVVSRKRA